MQFPDKIILLKWDIFNHAVYQILKAINFFKIVMEGKRN